MNHKDFIGFETLHKEYKEISFQHTGIPYTDSQIDEYVRSFHWDFNPLVLKSIKKYIHIYLPKYISSFLDKNTDLKEDGVLYFGISDNGTVSGIPYQGDLTLSDIFTQEIVDFLEHHLKCENGEWRQYMTVEMIPVSYTPELLSPVHPRLEEYDQKKNMLDSLIRKHNKKYLKWQQKNDLYTQKLVDLYGNAMIRRKFMKYLKKHNQIEMIREIINGATIEQKTYEEIRVYRERQDNLYYWMCRWKDEVLEELRKDKPVREKAYKNMLSHVESLYGPMYIFIKMENMVKWWMQHNQQMNLYVIKFTFKRPEIPLEISYKEYNKDKWIKSYRSLDEQKQPCCLPY